MNTLIHVAAGALVDSAGRILIAKRHQDTHQGGLWEFPGGKLEPGESLQQGLQRELWEELGVRVAASEPLIQIRHDYGDRHILLDVHLVNAYSGKPRGREDQPLRWVSPADMNPAEFPAADRPVINALRLPRRMLITGEDPHQPEAFLQRLGAALSSGIRLVQLRAHQLDPKAFRRLLRSCEPCCRAHDAWLQLNVPVSDWKELAGDSPRLGLHLTARRLKQLTWRPADTDRWVGASCHNVEELQLAADLGLDYALLSPVKATRTHPDSETLGWPGFAELAGRAALPVFALGGMEAQDLPRARALGGQGIAAISAFWR